MGNTFSNGATNARRKSLEPYCKPTGLYPSCPWEEKVVKRWIMDGRICPRYPALSDYYVSRNNFSSEDYIALSRSYSRGGVDNEITHCHYGSGDFGIAMHVAVECPICMNNYYAVNKTVCCSKNLCTECYLQVKLPTKSTICPFCNAAKLTVIYRGPVSPEEVIEKKIEEECNFNARMCARTESESVLESPTHGQETPSQSTPDTLTRHDRSGSVQYSTVQDRQRIESELRDRQYIPQTTAMESFWSNRGEGNSTNLQSYRTSGTNGLSLLLSNPNIQGMVELLGGPEVVSSIASSGGTLEQLEDMLLIEAVHLSLLEEHRRVRSNPNTSSSNEEELQYEDNSLQTSTTTASSATAQQLSEESISSREGVEE